MALTQAGNPTREETERKRAENEKKYALTPEQVQNIDVPVASERELSRNDKLDHIGRLKNQLALFEAEKRRRQTPSDFPPVDNAILLP